MRDAILGGGQKDHSLQLFLTRRGRNMNHRIMTAFKNTRGISKSLQTSLCRSLPARHYCGVEQMAAPGIVYSEESEEERKYLVDCPQSSRKQHYTTHGGYQNINNITTSLHNKRLTIKPFLRHPGVGMSGKVGRDQGKPVHQCWKGFVQQTHRFKKRRNTIPQEAA